MIQFIIVKNAIKDILIFFSELIKKLRKGNRLVFIKQVTNDDNEIWYYVQYKGNTGYVNSDFVTLLDSKPDSEQVADT